MKVTVIATGFGAGREGRAGATGQTPVDLQNYSTWYRQHHDAAAPPDSGPTTPSIPVRRRAVIAVPQQARAVVGGTPGLPPAEGGGDSDDTSPFDVPAFLRRQRDS
jgi:hypothetical protein